MKHNKNIGDLFKDKLESYEDSDINQDWDEMELKLNKLRFVKFSFTHFNIYYCSFALATFVLSSAVFIKTFFFQGDIQSNINSSAISDSTWNSKDESQIGSIADITENSTVGKKDKKASLKANASTFIDEKEGASLEKLNNKNINTLGKFNALDNNKSSNSFSDKEAVPAEKPNNKSIGSSDKINASDKNNPSSTDIGNDHITNKNSDNIAHSPDQTNGNVSHSSDQTTDKKQSSPSETNTVIDNLNIPAPKKKVIYITKQDTVEVFDTLRRKKPYKRK
jgi:hypothetical protein